MCYFYNILETVFIAFHEVFKIGFFFFKFRILFFTYRGWVLGKDGNFQYFSLNTGEISDIGDNRSEIDHENSFEKKIVEKSEILLKFC